MNHLPYSSHRFEAGHRRQAPPRRWRKLLAILPVVLPLICCCPWTPLHLRVLPPVWERYNMQGHALVHGKVVDQDGTPVKGVKIDARHSYVSMLKALIEGTGNANQDLEATTDAAGRFTIDAGLGRSLGIFPQPGPHHRLLTEGGGETSESVTNYTFKFYSSPQHDYIASFDKPAIYVLVERTKLEQGEVDIHDLEISRGGTTGGVPTGMLQKPVEPKLMD